MHGVEGKNPKSENAVFSCIFENGFAERNFILKEIKNILTKNKDATIGILLRNNYQVASWTNFINDAGLKTITRSESLGQKGVFNTIFSILKFIQNPFDNEVLVSTYETLAEHGFYKPRLQLEIRASEIPFIQKDGDNIESQDLSQFLWDMQYWLNSSTLPPEELVIRIGLFYYTSDIEKSNVYLIATLVKRLNSQGKFDLTLQRLEELSKKPSLSGFKFFSEEEDKDAMKGKVQIMTLHKSKGDEFEYEIDPMTANIRITKHTQNLNNIDISKIRAVYAVVIKEDGTPYVEIMTMDQVKKAWNQGAAKGGGPAHKNFTEEMAKKTVINRACKLFVNTTTDSALLVDSFNRVTSNDYRRDEDKFIYKLSYEIEKEGREEELEIQVETQSSQCEYQNIKLINDDPLTYSFLVEYEDELNDIEVEDLKVVLKYVDGKRYYTGGDLEEVRI